MESVNCKELSCVFLGPSLDRHIGSRPFYAASCLLQATVSLSFLSLSENSCVSAAHTHFHSPLLARPRFPPTRSIVLLPDLQLLESDLLIHVLLLFSPPKPGLLQWLPFLLFSHRIVRKEKEKKCNLNSFYLFLTLFF